MHLPDRTGELNIEESSVLAGLLRLGYENGVCLGIEAPGIETLSQPVKLHTGPVAVATAIQDLLGPSRFQIFEADGVIVLHNMDAMKRSSQLDVAVPGFGLGKADTRWASVVLDGTLQILADPSAQGFAGSLLGNPPDDTTGPFDEHGRTARELLTLIVGRSAGGSWVSGRCAAPKDLGGRGCWTLVQYRDSPETVSRVIGDIAGRLLREETLEQKKNSEGK